MRKGECSKVSKNGKSGFSVKEKAGKGGEDLSQSGLKKREEKVD